MITLQRLGRKGRIKMRRTREGGHEEMKTRA
jgi:hypothetical protein